MKNFWDKFKTSKTYIFIIGLTATLWFLFRVIPKPSRARYPCMQAAAPLMSSFVIYLLALGTSIYSLKKFKLAFQKSKNLNAFVFLFLIMISAAVFFLNDNKTVVATILNPVDDTFPVESNKPVGEAKGLFPGRVVWVHDDGATNENYIPQNGSSDFWYSDNNADPKVVEDMLASAIMNYAGTNNLTEAWDAIFKSYNNSNGRGEAGYIKGEKIAFKINLTNQGSSTRERPRRMDAAPQLINAILYQLTKIVGVDEKDITMGDPYREFRSEYRMSVMSKYPDVYYVDGAG